MRCPICNEIFTELNFNHVKKHGYKSFLDFKKDYPKVKGGIAIYHRNADLENRITAPQTSWSDSLRKLRQK